jgi:2-keto-4-pentenoate hydratase/2-oxohepta-3-ene-1,7-dioic acid hydratase in catechol pathway
VVTRDEILDVNSLSMWLGANHHKYQDGNTQAMIFDPSVIVSYISQYLSLESREIISTGTPARVGLGRNPAVYLKGDDKISLSIEGLGEQHQACL